MDHEDFTRNMKYDPVTGVFIRINRLKGRSGGNSPLGIVRGAISNNGYLIIGYKRKRYYAHRLAWFYVNGEWPSQDIDHINRDRSDNRLCNLRQATRSENNQNTRVRGNSSTGITGVTFHQNRWVAKIIVNKTLINLGRFKEKADAILARKEGERKYHPYNLSN